MQDSLLTLPSGPPLVYYSRPPSVQNVTTSSTKCNKGTPSDSHRVSVHLPGTLRGQENQRRLIDRRRCCFLLSTPTLELAASRPCQLLLVSSTRLSLCLSVAGRGRIFNWRRISSLLLSVVIFCSSFSSSNLPGCLLIIHPPGLRGLGSLSSVIHINRISMKRSSD